MKHCLKIFPALFIGLFAISSFAQPPEGPEGPQKGHRMWAELNLTAEQKTKIKEFEKTRVQDRKSNSKEMKAIRDKIRNELLKDNPSKKVLYKYANETGNLHKKISQAHADHLLEIKNILTKEQFAKLVIKEGKGPRKASKGMKRCNRKKCKQPAAEAENETAAN